MGVCVERCYVSAVRGGFLGMSGGVSEVAVGGGMGKEQGNL